MESSGTKVTILKERDMKTIGFFQYFPLVDALGASGGISEDT
jgi:hypothetical protein